jgi:hypothetical protein
LAWLHLFGPLNAPRGDYDHLRPTVARAIFAAYYVGRAERVPFDAPLTII